MTNLANFWDRIVDFWDDIVTWLGLTIQGPMTLAAVIQALAAVVGFLFITMQLRGATHDRLYAHYTEIVKLFMQYPELRPYFYESGANAAKALTPEEQSRIAFMSEAILGLVEHAVLQKWKMPRDAWTHCWCPYALERLEKSEEMQKFFDTSAHWYSRQMRRQMTSLRRQLDRNRAAKARTSGLAGGRIEIAH
jgi:hypothetical protein